jgi:adenylyl- and sulfurtransferase ThiI
MPVFLVRIAPEITTKARGTRRRFQQRLARNLRDALDAGVHPVEHAREHVAAGRRRRRLGECAAHGTR